MDEAGIDVESVQYVADVEDEMVRTPAGRLAAPVPLTEVIGEGVRPFHRTPPAEPSPRWVGVFLGICAVLFVPYIVQLAFQLPAHQDTSHYRRRVGRPRRHGTARARGDGVVRVDPLDVDRDQRRDGDRAAAG